jgi:predicted DCC family thiol-disulfide oxidoreductase YuxK
MPQHLLLYDDDCGFSRWCVGKVLAWDRPRRLQPLPLQAPESDELLPGMATERKMASWHLVAPGGEVYSGGAAAAPLLRLLPGGRPLAALAAAFPGAADRLYRWGADRRSLFGKPLRGASVQRADRRIALRRAR